MKMLSAEANADEDKENNELLNFFPQDIRGLAVNESYAHPKPKTNPFTLNRGQDDLLEFTRIVASVSISALTVDFWCGPCGFENQFLPGYLNLKSNLFELLFPFFYLNQSGLLLTSDNFSQKSVAHWTSSFYRA